MNKFLISLIALIATSSTVAKAQNHWEVYGNINLTKSIQSESLLATTPTGKPAKFSNKPTVGGAIGAGYETKFSQKFSFTSGTEFSFTNNGKSSNGWIAMVSWGNNITPYYLYNRDWRSDISLKIPLMIGLHFGSNKSLRYKLAVGPVLQQVITYWSYKQPYLFAGSENGDLTKSPGISNSSSSSDWGRSLGMRVQFNVETGNHLFYRVGIDTPVLSYKANSGLITLSLGAGYRF